MINTAWRRGRQHDRTQSTARVGSRLAVSLLLLTSTLLLIPAGARAHSPTIVSLIFDDGSASQYKARSLLASHRMNATFFVPSGYIQDAPSWAMSWQQLRDLYEDGNEIGGHTVRHVDLTQQTVDEQRRQVCDDRKTLISKGFSVTSFAYPYASYDARAQAIVQECGYSSGRWVGGLDSGSGVYAETIPPADRYATRTADASTEEIQLATLQRHVMRAESGDGGWVQILLHQVCEETDSWCLDSYGPIRRSTLEAFLNWLEPTAESAKTERTVQQEIEGGAQAPPADDGRESDAIPPDSTSASPPPPGGFFSLQPVGSWSTLPSGEECKRRIRYSTWEPRPENAKQNQTVPDHSAIDFESRPRRGGHDARWDSWLLPRVDGNFMGRTDEIFQWAACKWGLEDDLIRAIAAAESTWYQYLRHADGTCYFQYGCGDYANDPDWCAYTSRFGQHYRNPCPATFGITGVRSRSTSEGYPNNNNGTFPHNRDSTAFATEYTASWLRGCYEGWVSWLSDWGNVSRGRYRAGDIWGCVGAWFSGDWHDDAAERYISTVKGFMARHIWLEPYWSERQY